MIKVRKNGVIFAIIFVLVLGIVGFSYTILIGGLINESILSSLSDNFNAYYLIIFLFLGFLPIFIDTMSYVFSEDTDNRKPAIITMFSILIIMFIYNFNMPSEYAKNKFNEKYEEISKSDINFKDSDLGRELKVAIDTLNYKKVDEIFNSTKIKDHKEIKNLNNK